MKITIYILLGIALAYLLTFTLAEFGLILLAGAAFGLLLYIAIHCTKKSK